MLHQAELQQAKAIMARLAASSVDARPEDCAHLATRRLETRALSSTPPLTTGSASVCPCATPTCAWTGAGQIRLTSAVSKGDRAAYALALDWAGTMVAAAAYPVLICCASGRGCLWPSQGCSVDVHAFMASLLSGDWRCSRAMLIFTSLRTCMCLICHSKSVGITAHHEVRLYKCNIVCVACAYMACLQHQRSCCTLTWLSLNHFYLASVVSIVVASPPIAVAASQLVPRQQRPLVKQLLK
jgi:hypothetical protein